MRGCRCNRSSCSTCRVRNWRQRLSARARATISARDRERKQETAAAEHHPMEFSEWSAQRMTELARPTV